MNLSLRPFLALLYSVTLVFGLLVACGSEGPDVVDSSDASGSESADGSNGTSGETSGSSNAVDSDVSDDATIDSLDQSDRASVCEAGESYLFDSLSKEEYCRWMAQIFTALRQPDGDEEARETCSSLESQCLDSEGESTCDGISEGEGCSMTVEQWEKCEAALADRYIKNARNAPECSETGESYYANDGFPDADSSTPEACRDLEESCPDFFSQSVGPLVFVSQ